MKKVSEWNVERECGYCGVTWQIEKEDLRYEEEAVVGYRTIGHVSTIPEHASVFIAECEECGNDIMIEDDREIIPRAVSDSLKSIAGIDSFKHELNYARRNS